MRGKHAVRAAAREHSRAVDADEARRAAERRATEATTALAALQIEHDVLAARVREMTQAMTEEAKAAAAAEYQTRTRAQIHLEDFTRRLLVAIHEFDSNPNIIRYLEDGTVMDQLCPELYFGDRNRQTRRNLRPSAAGWVNEYHVQHRTEYANKPLKSFFARGNAVTG